MFCNACGNENPNAAKFCSACGQRLNQQIQNQAENDGQVAQINSDKKESWLTKIFKKGQTKKKFKQSVYTFFVLALGLLFVPYASVQLTLFSKEGVKEYASFALETGVFFYIPIIVTGIVTCYMEKYLFTIVSGALVALVGCIGAVLVYNNSDAAFGTTVVLNRYIIFSPIINGVLAAFYAKKLLKNEYQT